MEEKLWLNLDSMLKSRGITLPTRVRIVKAMVFSLVVYACESWTIKKWWELKNWCFQTVVLEKTLESPLDCKEIKPVNYKGNFKTQKTLCLPSPHTHPRFHWKITYIEKSVDSTYHNCKASQSFTNWTYPCNEHLDKKQNTNSVFWPSPARLPLNDYNDSTTTALLLAAAEITGWFALRLHFVMSQ